MYKRTVKTVCGTDEPHPYPVRRFTYSTQQVRADEIQRVIVYSVFKVFFDPDLRSFNLCYRFVFLHNNNS
jgi:hypothetical protein